MNTIDEIADAVHENAKAHGFHSKQSERAFLNEQLNNLHDEVSELHEAARMGTLHDYCDKSEKMIRLGLPILTCIEEEYADIIIRALDQCRRLKVDISRAIKSKHAFNKSRPYKHGKKY